MITEESPISQTLAVTEKQGGVGFKVELEQAILTDVKFDWWIIN